MPRVKRVDRPVRLEITLPESVSAAVELELFSDIEGRVPYGARSKLIEQLLRGWLESRGVAL